MRQKWLGSIFRHRFVVVLLLIIQIAILVYIIISTSAASSWINLALTIFSFFAALYIVGSPREKNPYKLTWIFLILIFPVFGGLLYLLYRIQSSFHHFGRRFKTMLEESKSLLNDSDYALEMAVKETPELATQINFLQSYAGFPIYNHTEYEYYTQGKTMFKSLIDELYKAEKYIFMEYYIIEEGVMWNSILDILRQKAASGIEVRVLYDDFGCFKRLPADYPQQLNAMGIKCHVFNPFRPFLSVVQNNRDHRKITVIDGKVAFTGGINLADEYINLKSSLGYWKDIGIMVKGLAVRSFVLMFLQMWNFSQNSSEQLNTYLPSNNDFKECPDDGFIQPFCDNPINEDNIGEQVYLQIINNAKQYVYLTTPYLLPDDNMLTALKLAAKSNVDVRIITPGHWDKYLVHIANRAYYRELIRGGIKVYEYKKGFVHGKSIIADDKTAVVGTINLDYRSFYLHFECGVHLYNSRVIPEIKKDILETISNSYLVQREDCIHNAFTRLIQEIARLISPLM